MEIDQIAAIIRDQVGEEVFVGEWLQMDQARIDRFAEATGDRQWIHTDPERAEAESPYGATIAHGYLTLSLVPHLTGQLGGWPRALPKPSMAVNYGLDRVRFPAAVRSTDRLRARKRLLQVERREAAVMLREEVTVERHGEQRPVCVAETLTLLFFGSRPQSAS